jgi:hypothetical protein
MVLLCKKNISRTKYSGLNFRRKKTALEVELTGLNINWKNAQIKTSILDPYSFDTDPYPDPDAAFF